MAAKYGLGEHVVMTHALSRDKGNTARTWKPYKLERYGVITGARTLSNGKVLHYYDEGYTPYVPEEYFTAYLVAWDMRHKPVLALPEHLEGVGFNG